MVKELNSIVKKFDLNKANEDFEEIIVSLETFHVLFYELGVLGVPVFTNEVPTAGVVFYKNSNNVGFVWNPDFWDTLTKYQRQFIACHEALHVFLSHGKRMMEAKQPQIANIAADVVVNEMLISKFNFSKELLGELSTSLIWLENTFSKEDNILKEESLEYYYKKLIEKIKEAIKDGSIGESSIGEGGIKIYPDDEFEELLGKPIDDHSGLKETFDKSSEQQLKSKLDSKLDDTEKENFKNLTEKDTTNKGNAESESEDHDKEAGTLAGNLCYTVKKRKTKYNYKWSDIIRNWKLRNDKPDEIEEVWHYPNRRMNALSNMFLPTEYDGNRRGQCEKVDVWFFMDTSGSCVHLKDKFFKCATSFPADKFNIKPFCFDTKVYDIDLKLGKLYGFGGTKFDIIEKKIQSLISNSKTKYPDVVFVFTDGYGNTVIPQYPKKWYWFLDGKYSTKDYIDKKSITYNLNDFE